MFLTDRFTQFRLLTSSFDLDETLSSFVNFVKDEAKENWKESILTAIQERGNGIAAIGFVCFSCCQLKAGFMQCFFNGLFTSILLFLV